MIIGSAIQSRKEQREQKAIDQLYKTILTSLCCGICAGASPELPLNEKISLGLKKETLPGTHTVQSLPDNLIYKLALHRYLSTCNTPLKGADNEKIEGFFKAFDYEIVNTAYEIYKSYDKPTALPLDSHFTVNLECLVESHATGMINDADFAEAVSSPEGYNLIRSRYLLPY